MEFEDVPATVADKYKKHPEQARVKLSINLVIEKIVEFSCLGKFRIKKNGQLHP